MNTITAEELKFKIDNNEDIQLIDLREDYEFEDLNIGGTNIPMAEILNSLDAIDKSKQVVFLCSSGKKSSAIIHTLKRKLNMDNILSLEGGVNYYSEMV